MTEIMVILVHLNKASKNISCFVFDHAFTVVVVICFYLHPKENPIITGYTSVCSL